MNQSNLFRRLWDFLLQKGKESLFTNAVFILGLTVVPGVVGFVFWNIISRSVSTADAGFVSTFFSIVSLLSGAACLGMGDGLIRFLPGAKEPVRLINTAFLIDLFSSILFGIIFIAGLSIWSPKLMILKTDPAYIALLFAFILASNMISLLRDIFISHRNAANAFYLIAIANGLRILLLFFGVKAGAIGIIGSTTLSFVIALIAVFIFLFPSVIKNYSVGALADLSTTRPFLRFSISNYFVSFLAILPQTVLPVITFNLLSNEASAYTYIALMLGSILVSPGLALSTSAFAEASNDPDSYKNHLLKAAKVGLSITVPLAIFAALLAPWIMRFFNPGYIAGVPLFRWFCLAAPFIVFNQLLLTSLRIKKKNRILLGLSLLISIATIFLSVFWMPGLGISGCGVSLVVVNVTAALILGLTLLMTSSKSRS